MLTEKEIEAYAEMIEALARATGFPGGTADDLRSWLQQCGIIEEVDGGWLVPRPVRPS